MPASLKPSAVNAAKAVIFVLALVPVAGLVRDALTGNLSAEPIDQITRLTGEWTLRFLLITLAVTPLRQLTGWHSLVRLRRTLGLFAFFYACLHLLTYLVLDQFFDWDAIVEDIVERTYILVGFSAFCLLVPLAVTSTNAMMRRLGGKRWQRLHRLVYVAAIGGVLHFLWLVKADATEPLVYAAVLLVLLGYRLYRRGARRTAARASTRWHLLGGK